MDFFKQGIKILGGQQNDEGEQQSYADVVERLVERLQTSTLLDDRRDACRALKSFSRKYRVEVGAQAMDGLCQVLQNDAADAEIIGYALDSLVNITTPHALPEEEVPIGGEKTLDTVGVQFTEIFIKVPDNVGIVLGLLDEYNFRVRWPAVKLLSNLVLNKPKDVQEIVLISPMGVSKLMDLLSDNREVVRNDALLLLIQLTKGNANIQKIVAFENAFDKIFEIVSEEGYADGGIIVEDCLLFMLNLLKNNASNQNFFKEGSYIQRLKPMFQLPNDQENSENWSSQKISNIFCVLQVIRSLVAPTNPTQVTSSCQKAAFTSGILQSLCSILMANGVPVSILTESINATADIIRGNFTNQEYFASIQAPCTPPREAVIILLMSMVNEKQPIALRCAVLYCFQCFLFKNEMGQSKLVRTLLPSSIEQESISTGQLLCAGLFNADSASNWFSAISLSHALVDNPGQRELMLKVMLTPSQGSLPVPLICFVSDLLQKTTKYQSKLGLLILLSTWLSHCPLAVNHFLEIPTNVPYLTAQIGALEHDENEELIQGLCSFLMGLCLIFNDDTSMAFSKENLYQLIVKRVGVENFLAKLNDVSRHEVYGKTSKHPQLYCKTAKELLLDYEFCKLFKILEGMIVRAVTSKNENGIGNSSGGDDNVDQYKDLIRDQDRRLYELESEKNCLNEQLRSCSDELEDARKLIYNLQTHNTNMKLLESGLRNQLANLNSKVAQLSVLEVENETLKKDITQLRKDQEDLLELLADQESKIERYESRLKELGYPVDNDVNNEKTDDSCANEQHAIQSIHFPDV